MALQKVTEIKDDEKRCETMLKYASIFINKCCKETIDELKKPAYKKIKIPNLMPAFMNIRVDKDDKPVGDDMKIALEYITNHCINRKNVKAQTVHNMAFFFHSKINNPRKMIEFLEGEEMKKSKGLSIYFEVDYALNICKQNEKKLMEEITHLINYISNKQRSEQSENDTIKELKKTLEGFKDKLRVMKKAQVIIYAILNHFDKSVKIALQCGDIDMAKQYANKPDDKKLKKKLWMKIAKYLFNYQGKRTKMSAASLLSDPLDKNKNEKYKINEALEILKDSKLKIDDLLPLFPPDEKVQDMKDHLSKCLNDYHHSIKSLKSDLETHSAQAELLRK